jgi:hypothetical protein
MALAAPGWEGTMDKIQGVEANIAIIDELWPMATVPVTEPRWRGGFGGFACARWSCDCAAVERLYYWFENVRLRLHWRQARKGDTPGELVPGEGDIAAEPTARPDVEPPPGTCLPGAVRWRRYQIRTGCRR